VYRWHTEGEIMTFRKIAYRWVLFGALALACAIGARAMPVQSPDSDEISKLLVEAKSRAILAENDAAELDSFARTRITWESHAHKLRNIREHVNELGKVCKELSDLRAQGSPWQQTAIDQIDPLLREMAHQLTVTINHLNDNQSRVHMQEYRDYAHANYEVAVRTAQVIRDFVDYDEAKSKAGDLEAKLNIAIPYKDE
jgi:hypothetical protein